jgi:hypothetical protein
MEEHWQESAKDMTKTLTGKNNKNKERSKALGARLDQQEGVYVDGFRSRQRV